MRITFFSDTHFGFGQGTERWEDSFNAVREIIRESSGSDLILVAGDIFDTKTPSTETLAKAMEIFIQPLLAENNVVLKEGIGKDVSSIPSITTSGTPVIVISGNHERRIKGLLNPVQAMEKAGFLIHLHCNGVVLEKGGERVCIQGMSAVPDQYFESALKQWDPRPLDGCTNILMIHHLLSPITFSRQKISSLPEGFDFYLCGDLHDRTETVYSGSPFLIPGSVIPTQINEGAARPRGFFIINTKNSIEYKELESQRNVYFIEGHSSGQIDAEIKLILKQDHKLKPIIRVTAGNDMPFGELKAKHQDSAIIIVKKEPDQQGESMTIEEHKLSVREMGTSMLRKNISSFGLDEKIYEEVFELLLNKKTEEAAERLVRHFS